MKPLYTFVAIEQGDVALEDLIGGPWYGWSTTEEARRAMVEAAETNREETERMEGAAGETYRLDGQSVPRFHLEWYSADQVVLKDGDESLTSYHILIIDPVEGD